MIPFLPQNPNLKNTNNPMCIGSTSFTKECAWFLFEPHILIQKFLMENDEVTYLEDLGFGSSVNLVMVLLGHGVFLKQVLDLAFAGLADF